MDKQLLQKLMKYYEFAFRFGLHVLDRAIKKLIQNVQVFIRIGDEDAAEVYTIVLVRAVRIAKINQETPNG